MNTCPEHYRGIKNWKLPACRSFSVGRKIALAALLFFVCAVNVDAAVTTNITRPPNNLGLVGYWTFDGDSVDSTTVTDVSGNGNNGTIEGDAKPALGILGHAFDLDGDELHTSPALPPA